MEALAASYSSKLNPPCVLENLYIVGPMTVGRLKNESEWLLGLAAAIYKAFAKQRISLKTVTVEMRRDVEQYPYNVKPLPHHYRPAQRKRGRCSELTEILDLREADLTLMRGFGAGVERTIDAYIRNATEWDTFV